MKTSVFRTIKNTFSNIVEVSGRLSSEKNLDISNSQILENVGDGTFLFDKSGEVEFISNSAKKLFACQKFELSGSGLFDRTHIMDRPLFLRSFDLAKRGKKPQKINIRMRFDNNIANRKNAEYIWVNICFSSLISSKKETSPFRLLAVFRDISEQKKEELALKIQKDKQSPFKEKTHFLAMIGHELRTPLNAIVGFSDMLTNEIGGELNSKQMDYAKHISQSGHHLLDVVNSLLDMSKINSGKLELNCQIFDLSDIIAPSIQIISKLAKDKKIGIEVRTSDNLPQILADEASLRQILINLLSNAIKFSDPNSSVICTFKRQGHYIKMSVKDEGIGMNKDQVLRLGEPFYQAHAGNRREYEGSGLGISIVKGLTDLHQGIFEVKTEKGLGTIVDILLPIAGPIKNIKENNKIMPIIRASNFAVSVQGESEKQRRVVR